MTEQMVGISVNISLLASTMLYSKGRNYYHYSWALIVVLYEQSCIKEAGFHVVVRVSTCGLGLVFIHVCSSNCSHLARTLRPEVL